ncbi:MAG: prepilin-type N-terminal cleavage/methylation domain-containing protein [Planctomycetota bacterium]|jgi:hypothetical protein|nr:prepilin-type N-terminal cleavage/methylation domain-containing protein [Planctomycetota bacterium]
MKPYRRRGEGFTLVEATISLAIFSAVALSGYALLSRVYGVARLEESLLRLDVSADQAGWRLSELLRPAILPVTLESGSKAGTSYGTIINDPAWGFGQYGGAWLEILKQGTDCLAFALPIDWGNDGDYLDSDLMLEMGIVLPNGSLAGGASYHIDGLGGNHLENDRSIHQYLAQLNPLADLGLTPGRNDIVPGGPRFKEVFAFPPASALRAFALIRFVPLSEAGNPKTVKESELTAVPEGFDLNADGDKADSFLLGRLEIVYPPWVGNYDRDTLDEWDEAGFADGASSFSVPITEDVVLLQINQSEQPDGEWRPIFRLEYPEEGNFALRMQLLLFDESYRPFSSSRAVPYVSRYYETLVRLRGM